MASNIKPYSDGEIMKQVIAIFTKKCCFTNIQLKLKA